MFQSPSAEVEGFYRMLGVEEGATEKEIKAAFRERSKEVHPDLNDSDNADEKFDFLKKSREVVEMIELEGKHPKTAVSEVYNEAEGISRERERRRRPSQPNPSEEETTQESTSEQDFDGAKYPGEEINETTDEDSIYGAEFSAMGWVAAASLLTLALTRLALMPDLQFETGLKILGGAGIIFIALAHGYFAQRPVVDTLNMGFETNIAVLFMVYLFAGVLIYASASVAGPVALFAYMAAGTLAITATALTIMDTDMFVFPLIVLLGTVGAFSRPFPWVDFGPFLLGLVVNMLIGGAIALVALSMIYLTLEFYIARPPLHEPQTESHSSYGWAVVPILMAMGVSYASLVYTPWYAIWGLIGAPVAMIVLTFARGLLSGWSRSPEPGISD